LVILKMPFKATIRFDVLCNGLRFGGEDKPTPRLLFVANDSGSDVLRWNYRSATPNSVRIRALTPKCKREVISVQYDHCPLYVSPSSSGGQAAVTRGIRDRISSLLERPDHWRTYPIPFPTRAFYRR